MKGRMDDLLIHLSPVLYPDPISTRVHTANIARLQRRVPKAANLFPPERDAGDRMLQRASQPRRHLPVHARRILVSGGIGII